VANTFGVANRQTIAPSALGDTQQGRATAPGWTAAAQSRAFGAFRRKSAKAAAAKQDHAAETAARRAAAIPIVATTGVDPVSLGIAASLARPGSNFTGAVADSGSEYYAKLLELLKEAIPTLSTVGFIGPPAFWGNPLGPAMLDAAPHLGIQLIPGLLERYEEADYRNVFGAMAQRHVDAVLLSDQVENFTHRRLIVELAETNRLPTMSLYIEVAEIGGLIAYAPDLKAQFRYLASCVDKILRGENPGEIPIYKSARFNLAINLKTAKALGLVIPASLVARADFVIE
jgi:putative ABC transport system substrate-binding protein